MNLLPSKAAHDQAPLRRGPVLLGKIGYLNVLPIYHPLETGVVENDFKIVSGPPSRLNEIMARGGLELSAASSIEYARRPQDYYLVPDLAIGSCGPVQSVLLLSRGPLERLEGKTVLVSAQTHTSAALLKILLHGHLRVNADFHTDDATSRLAGGQRPDAILAIGDEALELRRHPDYPHAMDLGESWRQWTGLPFIFGLWLVSRRAYKASPERLQNACKRLLRAKQWGQRHLGDMCNLAANSCSLDAPEMCSYFNGLVYDLGRREQQGLAAFFEQLAANGMIERAPDLHFLPQENTLSGHGKISPDKLHERA